MEATNSKVINGTPRMNSIKETQTILTAGKCDIRPSASNIPIGNEKMMPVTHNEKLGRPRARKTQRARQGRAKVEVEEE